MNKLINALIPLLGTIACVGCAGGHGTLAANSAKYPISMSSGVRDPEGKLLGDKDLKEVGKVKTEYHAWSMFWNMIPLSGERDISEEINSQVQTAGGEAVVGLEVTASNCTWNFFTLIGFLPDCASVAVEGRIVKRTDVQASAPALAPPKAPQPSTVPEAPKDPVASPAAAAAPASTTTAVTPAAGAAQAPAEGQTAPPVETGAKPAESK